VHPSTKATAHTNRDFLITIELTLAGASDMHRTFSMNGRNRA